MLIGMITTAVFMASGSAYALITPASTCNSSDILTGVGYSVTGCTGFYSGNLNNAADFSDVKALIQSQFSGITLGNGIIEQDNTSSTPFNFATALTGNTVIGIHWGGQGGGDTSFYELTIGSGFTGLNLKTTNPFLGSGGLSNVALYYTSAVPEPEPYGMIISGLGLIGFMVRRRKNS